MIALLGSAARGVRRWVAVAAALNVVGAALTVVFGVLVGHVVATSAALVWPGAEPFTASGAAAGAGADVAAGAAAAAGASAGTGAGVAAVPTALAGWLQDVFGWGMSARAAWALVLAVLARTLVAWAKARLGESAAAAAIADLRARALRAVALADPRAVDRAHWQTVLTVGLDNLRPYITGFLPAALATALATPVALLAIAALDIPSAIWAAATIPLIPFFMWLVGTLTRNRTERKLADLARLSDQMVDVAAGLPTLVAHRRQFSPIKEVQRLATAHRHSTMAVLRIAFLSSLVLEFLATLSVALVAVNIGFRLLGGHMTLSAGLAILIIVPEVYAPLRAVGTQFHAAQDGVTALRHVNAALRGEVAAGATDRNAAGSGVAGSDAAGSGVARSEATGSEAASPGAAGSDAATSGRAKVEPSTINPAEEGISIAFREYSSPGRDGQRPYRLTAQAVPGQLTVLAGPNGSGKSTALLAALDICGGTGQVRATLGGRQLRGEDLWQYTVYLPQRPVLAEDTLGDTAPLSLGQRQVESLRRELAAADQRGAQRRLLLVADEPTAHLDAQSAERVIAQLRQRAAAGATVLVASHDPLLLQAADVVVAVAAHPSSPIPAGSAEGAGLAPAAAGDAQ